MLLLFLIRMATEHIHQSVVLVDEVELHQHPVWQRKLLHTLGLMGDGNQVIATTHSPYLREAAPRGAVKDSRNPGRRFQTGSERRACGDHRRRNVLTRARKIFQARSNCLVADVHLVCEGPADGLDVRVLDAVVAQILSVPVLISAAGGNSSLGSVAAWLEEKSRRQLSDGSLSRPTASALCIQDRNYRPCTEAQVGWNRSDAKRLIWLRHEIENYLLEPLVVLATFDSFRRTVIAPWAHALPTDAPAVTGLLASLAQPQLEDHVGQLVLAELRAAKGAAGETNFNLSRPLPSSGAVHPGRSEWLSALTQEVRALKGDFIAIGNLKIWKRLRFKPAMMHSWRRYRRPPLFPRVRTYPTSAGRNCSARFMPTSTPPARRGCQGKTLKTNWWKPWHAPIGRTASFTRMSFRCWQSDSHGSRAASNSVAGDLVEEATCWL